MSALPRRCPGCGAEVPRREARFCERCGTELPPAPAAPPGPEATDPIGDRTTRFAALRAHPELARCLARRPDVPELRGRTLPSVLLLLLAAVASLGAAAVLVQLCPPLGFALAALVPVAAFVLARNLLASARTPIVARAALVVGLRTVLQAGARPAHSSARHVATLEEESGARLELECMPSALPALALGRAGVAYVQGDRLAAFEPLDG